MAQLLGPDGRPIVAAKKTLPEEVARPGLTGVRQAWSAESAVAGLTPDRLEAILRQANQGDMDAFLVLAEEMEERDPHYGSVLQTRKLAVLGLDRQLTWSKGQEDDARAEEILEACAVLVDAPAFEDLIEGSLDSIAKGYSATEILWDTSGNQWRPKADVHRDPRWFRFDRATGRELRLREAGALDGVPLPPFKFAVHLAGRKSGLPARSGLARLVAFSFVCKLYGLKDWMAYAEIFGIPLRLGRYDGSASPADVEVLKRAVFGLGSDAAAVIPKSMDIEFPQLGAATSGTDLFEKLVKFIDSQVSKAVLGQTMTTDDGSSRAQAQVHDEVRTDLLKADARGTGKCVTRDVLAPFVAFNWGPDAPVPRLNLVVDEPEDIESLSTALERLVPLGLRVDQAEVRSKLKLTEPADDASVLTPPARTEPKVIPPPALTRDRRRPALARAGRAAAVERREAVADALDEIQLAALDGWEQTFGVEAEAVIGVVREAASFEEVVQGLDRMAGDLAAPATARALARAMFQAAALAKPRERA